MYSTYNEGTVPLSQALWIRAEAPSHHWHVWRAGTGSSNFVINITEEIAHIAAS